VKSNERILATILATLNSDEASAHGSPVTRFKEAIDKYFKKAGHGSATLSGGLSPIRYVGGAHFDAGLNAPSSSGRSQPVKKVFEVRGV